MGDGVVATCVVHQQAPATGTCTRCGGFLCESCMVGGLCAPCVEREPLEKPARPIGGWLVLVGLGLFANPLLFFSRSILVAVEVRKAGGVRAVLDLDPKWFWLSVFDVTSAAYLAGLSLFAMPAFFTKRRAAVVRLQWLYASLAVINVVMILLQKAQGNPEDPAQNGVMQLVLPILWLSYLSRSVRVRETFVR